MELPTPLWTSSEEDQSFCSQVVQWLLHDDSTLHAQRTPIPNAIPKIVVQYWHDLQALPGDVADCMQSWRQLERDGFHIRLFDDVTARRFIATEFDHSHVTAYDRCYHPAMRCDYFRLCYIFRHGGFYVDADDVYKGAGWEGLFEDTSLKLQPLCYDQSTGLMVPPEEFLHDKRYPSSRFFYVNNNPIIAPPNHPIMEFALRRSTSLLLQQTERPEIQSTTGPVNLLVSLVGHYLRLRARFEGNDFAILRNWNAISEWRWNLSYRNDERNWRLAGASRPTPDDSLQG